MPQGSDTFRPIHARTSVNPRPLVFLALLLALPAAGAAQPAARIADLTTAGYTGSVPGQFALFAGVTYFRARDEANGFELWRTDGTAAGTRLVEDLVPGPDSSSPRAFTVAGDRLFFVAAGTLWKTDGTSAGTVRVQPGLRDPLDLVALDGILYFTVDQPGFGRELWRTDGTTDGTSMVKDILPGPVGAYPWFTVAFQGALYFGAIGPEGDEVWTSDGTEAGTVLVRDLVPGPAGSDPLHLTVAGGLLFFTADDDVNGREVWKTDGTGAGTVMVLDIAPGAFGQIPSMTPAAVGSRIFFGADDGVAGSEPWVSDGTIAGTFRLRDVQPGAAPSFPVAFTAVGDAAYFTADDGSNGTEVWRSDGSSAGTAMLGPVSAGSETPYGLTSWGGALFFSADDGTHGRELWRADGTALTLFDLNPGPLGSESDAIYPAGDAFYLGATPAGQDPALSFGEPWISDGTPAGTHLLAALQPGASSSMSYGVAFADAYYFLLSQPATGYELWRSDGTAAGTQLFLDLWPGPQSGFPASFVVKGGLLYFLGRDAAGAALFRTDGTPTGTSVVKRFPEDAGGTGVRPMVLAGDRLFLIASTSAAGPELWTSDGTEAGTVLVRDLNPGPTGSLARELTPLGQSVLFVAFDGAAFGLFASDGTTPGTVRLTPATAASPSGLVAAGGRVFFIDDDPTHGREPWVTDGSAAGTGLLGDLVPGPGGSLPFGFVALGGGVVFTALHPSAGHELWHSDGTPGGTALVADLVPGPAGSSPSGLVATGAFVFFAADDGITGREPWRTDGTPAGTSRLADLWPGADSSLSTLGARGAWGGAALFAAATPGRGAELFRTDGTPAGTRLVQDIGPGESSAGIEADGPGNELTPAAGRLFFRAVDEAGREPWSLLPELAVGDATAVEGALATFTVVLEPPVDRPVSVAFATADLTATAGSDYVPVSGTLTFAPGEASRTVAVTLLDDGLVEGQERFALTLGAAQAAYVRDGSGIGSIADDDAAPALSVGDAAVDEGDAGQTTATFVVTRTGSTASATVVPYATFDGTAIAGSGNDFQHVSGDLTFPPGVATRTVDVPVLGDVADEPDERFLLVIGPAPGATIARGVGYGTIRDDDGADVRLRELGHGATVREHLPAGAAPVEQLYLIVRDPHGSCEIVLDEASGDLGDAGPLLQRVAPDLSTVLQESVPAGAGPARSLRMVNDLDVPLVSYVRVRSAGCTTDCGDDDVYRLRVRDTTGRVPRFNASGGQATVVLLQNRSDGALAASVTYWKDDGTEGSSPLVTIPPRGIAVVPTPSLSVGDSGSLTVAHDGAYGALAGKAVALDPRTGLAFDTPLETRPR
jgi:ELWxxDGT repeat protein